MLTNSLKISDKTKAGFLSSDVTVLTNSLKISDQTKAGFVQLNLPRNHGKIR